MHPGVVHGARAGVSAGSAPPIGATAAARGWVAAPAVTLMMALTTASMARTTVGHGYCSTTGDGMGDCLAGHIGSWKLSSTILKKQTVSSAMDECVAGCLLCSRCNYVSTSLFENECAWTHRCDMSNLLHARKARGVWRTSLVRNGSNVERVAVGKAQLELHDVVPWSHTVPKLPVPLYVVSGKSIEWIMQEKRGEALVAFWSGCSARNSALRRGPGPG